MSTGAPPIKLEFTALYYYFATAICIFWGISLFTVPVPHPLSLYRE